MPTLFQIFQKKIMHALRFASGAGVLAVLVVVGLFFIEAVPAQLFTQKAEAWSCSVTLSQINTSATLSWSVSSDVDFVTVNGVAGQFGKTGSMSATPGQTYFIQLHLNGATAPIGGCGTDGSVSGPSCASQTLSLNGNQFTWAGPMGFLEQYYGELCDGTLLGSSASPILGHWVGDTVTIPLASRIKTLTACGNGCTKTAVQTCPAVVSPAPTCSMSASPTALQAGGTSVVSWNTTNVASASFNNGITATATTTGSVTVSPPLGSTTYVGTFVGTNGSTITCSATVQVTTTPPPAGPSCTLSINPSVVASGGSATMQWSTNNAQTFVVNNGIGSLTVAGGSQALSNITENKTYTGTATAQNGTTAVCSANVSIQTDGGGGGGNCLNCGGGGGSTHQSSPTILLSQVVKYPGGFITLNQVPYTGFEAGPLITTFFWLVVFAISGMIAHVLTAYHPFAQASAIVRAQRNTPTSSSAHTPLSFLAPIYSLAHMQPNTSPTPSLAQEEVLIEEVGQQRNILVSPEAIRLIREAFSASGMEQDAFLDRVYTKTEERFSREEGWILLSKARVMPLLAELQQDASHPEALSNTVSQHTSNERLEEKSSQAQMPKRLPDEHLQGERPFRATPPTLTTLSTQLTQPYKAPEETKVSKPSEDNVLPQEKSTTPHTVAESFTVHAFVHALVEKDQRQVFALLQNTDTETAITETVRALDAVYRARGKTGTPSDVFLTEKTASLTTADFETLLSLLLGCLDNAYTDTSLGIKIALTNTIAFLKTKKK